MENQKGSAQGSQGPIQTIGTMNVLKSSGGHISGMNHYRGVAGSATSTSQGMNGNGVYKPLSSPRSSQQHNGHMKHEDPNFLY